MRKLIFYIKAFFLVIKLLLERGYKPAWVRHYNPEDDYYYNEFEAAAVEGGLYEFAECIVTEIHYYLHFDYKFGETLFWRNYFYDNYKKQKMLNRKDK